MQEAKRLEALAELWEHPLNLRIKTVDRIGEKCFQEKAAVNNTFPIPLRVAVVKRVKRQKLLSEIVWSKCGRELCVSALMNLSGREQIKCVRDGSDDSELRQCVYGLLGHDMNLVKYVHHGPDGRDALYKCEICRKEKLEPYESSTADSV